MVLCVGVSEATETDIRVTLYNANDSVVVKTSKADIHIDGLGNVNGIKDESPKVKVTLLDNETLLVVCIMRNVLIVNI
jgi:hypothetical protein